MAIPRAQLLAELFWIGVAVSFSTASEASRRPTLEGSARPRSPKSSRSAC